MPKPNLSDYIKVYEEQLPGETCEAIIRRFEETSKDHVRRGIRNIKAFTELNFEHLDDWHEIRTDLEKRARDCLKRYQRECAAMFPNEYEFESYRIKRYEPAAGDVFGRHVDGFDGLSALRFLVLFWYLNDVDEGGETWFPDLKLRVRPKQGRVLMFPPFWLYQHAGLKPVSGPKYIVGSYITFPRPGDF